MQGITVTVRDDFVASCGCCGRNQLYREAKTTMGQKSLALPSGFC
jgi:hypothetical protein